MAKPIWSNRPLNILPFLALLLGAQVQAASPREELLRLVPENVAFCVVIQDLRGHAEALHKSPFVTNLNKTPLGQFLDKSDDFKKLAGADALLKFYLGLDATQLRDDIFGDAVVFAYRPGPPDKPDAEEGLALIHARDAKALADLVNRLNEKQKEAGDVKAIKDLTYQDETYHCRVESKGNSYYWLKDHVLTVSTQEVILRQAIDSARSAKDRESPVAKQFRLLGADKQFLSVWVNPRAFDSEVKKRAKSAKAPEANALQAFLGYWTALEGIALTVDLQKNLEISLTVRADPKSLSEATRRFLAEAAKPSELWGRVPSKALFVVAGRLDLSSLVEVVSGFLTTEMRQAANDKIKRTIGFALEKDLLKDVLPNLGPDWGLCVTAPPVEDKEHWFPSVVLVGRVRPGDGQPPVDSLVLKEINFFARLGVLVLNQQLAEPVEIKTVTQNKAEVTYVEGKTPFPPGLQPAYTLHGGFLLLASSPEAIGRFLANSAKASDLALADGEVPLLLFSIKDTASYLKDHRSALSAYAVEKNHISREEANKQMDGLLAVMGLLDRIEVIQRGADRQFTLTLRVTTVQPLK